MLYVFALKENPAMLKWIKLLKWAFWVSQEPNASQRWTQQICLHEMNSLVGDREK